MNSSFHDLTVYKKAFSLAMEIFKVSKDFPNEEKYSLTDQIRRSSRSVCSAIAEGYRKKDIQKTFYNKISDADMENSETQVWLNFASECNYLNKEKRNHLTQKSEEVGRLLNHMLGFPEKYLRKNEKNMLQ